MSRNKSRSHAHMPRYSGEQETNCGSTESVTDIERVVASLSTHCRDPITKHCRIYVGNICKQKVTRGELYVRFAVYGNITAISAMNSRRIEDNNFAFIQYTKKEDAESAVSQENKSMMSGVRLGTIVFMMFLMSWWFMGYLPMNLFPDVRLAEFRQSKQPSAAHASGTFTTNGKRSSAAPSAASYPYVNILSIYCSRGIFATALGFFQWINLFCDNIKYSFTHG